MRKRRHRQIGRLIYHYCCVRYLTRKDGRWVKDTALCPVCDGTGEYKPFDAEVELNKLADEPTTNEEWFCQLPTTEKSEFLSAMVKQAIEVHEKHGTTWHEAVSWWDGWLKEKHNDK